VLQLSLYSEQVGHVQEAEPDHMRVILGDRRLEEFRYAEFDSYFRRVRDQFLEAIREEKPGDPVPIEHCETCDWSSRCRKQWEESDHLSLVANIRQSQMARLRAAGITTLEALAESRDGHIPRLSPDTFSTLRDQAQLQLGE